MVRSNIELENTSIYFAPSFTEWHYPLSFSKKVDNHVGAIWYFIHHYNASLV
jgi:hypothetical protein